MQNRPMSALFAVSAALCLLPLQSSCQLVQRVRANKMVVLTWLSLPTIPSSAFADVPEAKGGVVATAIFGDRQGGTTPVPQSGAFAAFFGRGKQFVMAEKDPEKTPGVYSVSSQDDERLFYDSDPERRFGFKACSENRDGCFGEEFILTRIRAAPSLDASAVTFDPAFTPPLLPDASGAHAANTDLMVNFPPPADEFKYRPLITVIGPTGDTSKPVGQLYSTLPTGGAELIKFVTEEPVFTLTVPGSTFARSGLYLILVTSARLNLDASDNLFIASGALAGAMNAYVIEVQGGDLPIPNNLPGNLPGNLPI